MALPLVSLMVKSTTSHLKQRSLTLDLTVENGDGEVDQHFWAQANQASGDDIDQSK